MNTNNESLPPQKTLPDDRLLAAIGYLGVLCVLPLVLRRDSAFAQHHGKQGLVLLIAWLVLWISNVVPILGQIIWVLGTLVLLVLIILGIVNALNGNMWEMPVLGSYAKMIKL